MSLYDRPAAGIVFCVPPPYLQNSNNYLCLLLIFVNCRDEFPTQIMTVRVLILIQQADRIVQADSAAHKALRNITENRKSLSNNGGRTGRSSLPIIWQIFAAVYEHLIIN